MYCIIGGMFQKVFRSQSWAFCSQPHIPTLFPTSKFIIMVTLKIQNHLIESIPKILINIIPQTLAKWNVVKLICYCLNSSIHLKIKRKTDELEFIKQTSTDRTAHCLPSCFRITRSACIKSIGINFELSSAISSHRQFPIRRE